MPISHLVRVRIWLIQCNITVFLGIRIVKISGSKFISEVFDVFVDWEHLKIIFRFRVTVSRKRLK